MCDSKIHCNYFVRKQEDLTMNLPIEFEKKMKAFLGDEWYERCTAYDSLAVLRTVANAGKL